MKSNNIFAMFLSASVGLLMPFYCSAHTYLNESLEHASNRAIAVLDVRVSRADLILENGVPCGYKYEALIKNAIKQGSNGNVIVFGFIGGIEAGHSYRVFLSDGRTPNDPGKFLRQILRDDVEVERRMNACSGFYKGLFVFRYERLTNLAPVENNEKGTGR